MGETKLREILYIERFDWKTKTLKILPVTPPFIGTQYDDLRKFTKTLELLGVKPLAYGWKILRKGSDEAVRKILVKVSSESPVYEFF